MNVPVITHFIFFKLFTLTILGLPNQDAALERKSLLTLWLITEAL